jgi:hypothetical protein
MRQRLESMDCADGSECIQTIEPDSVVSGRNVAFSPARELPRSFANWQRHKACMVAAPAMADLLEEIRDAIDVNAIYNRPEVVALLESIKQ